MQLKSVKMNDTFMKGKVSDRVKKNPTLSFYDTHTIISPPSKTVVCLKTKIEAKM